MLVSFIIPSYNSAHTVKRCFDSIYALSLKQEEFEVIFIDDCSTDNTCEIVAMYQEKYGNLTLLQQPTNNRQGAARNRGVKEAKGEYICFVDADDAVTEGIVKAIRMAKDKMTDMSAYHYAFVNENGLVSHEADKLSFEEGQLFSGIELQNKHPYWCSGPVAYVYSKEFLERVNYPFVEGVLYEDSDFVAVHLYYAERMTYSAELGYKAYEREGSTTRQTTYKSVADYLLLGERMLRFYEQIKVESGMRKAEGVEQFAERILEGACWNIQKSCKRLKKLGNIKEVGEFYKRVDAHLSRIDMSKDEYIRKYYWTIWTALCLKHKNMTKMILAMMIPVYKLVKRK